MHPKHKNLLVRFLKFSTSGTSTTLLDLLILGLLTEWLGMHYLLSATLSYLTSSSISYTINKNWGFRDSKAKILRSYSLFIILNTVGLAITVFLMWIFVDFLGVYYLLARIIVASIGGIVNFFLHSHFTFQVIDVLSFIRRKS